MANFNSRRYFNKKIPDGGANFNSAPFTIIVLDNGTGADNIGDILANIDIKDDGIGDENIVAIATLEIMDKSISSDDSVSITNNINIADDGIGKELLSVIANLNITDNGIGKDNLSDIVAAFFVIDSNKILHPLGVRVTGDSRLELLPATRDNTEEIPGRHGEIDFGTELKARPLELHVVTKEGYSPLAKSRLQRFIAKYLDPTKGAKTLIFSDDIEKTYKVKYSGRIDLSEYATWFKFTIPFKMSDPFITGSFEKVLTGNGILVNEGTCETGLIVEIYGPTTNPSLTIGGEILSYTGTISTGTKLIIDTGMETAKIGSSNALGDYNGVFPMLQPGETNVISSSNITIKWRDKWI